MTHPKDKPSPRRPALPAGFTVHAGRVLPPAGASSATAPRAPRAEGMPPDPEKNKEPAAADPRKCAECGADVPPGAKFCPECGAKMPAEGEAAEVPSDKEAAAFAGFALGATAAKSLDVAKGTMLAWREKAGKADALAADLANKSARLATIERERLLERAVAEGRLDPGEAWSWSVDKDGNKVRSFSAWSGPPDAEKGTGQSLEQLAAFVAQRTPAPATGKPLTPAPKKPAEAAPPPGLNPETYAAARRQVAELLGEES